MPHRLSINYAAKLYLVGDKSIVGHSFCSLQYGVYCFKDMVKPFLVSKRFSHKSGFYHDLHFLRHKASKTPL